MQLKSLKVKFIVYFIPLILFISLSFLTFFINRSNYLIKQELTELGFSLVKNLSYSSEIAVASEDEIFLKPYLEGIFKEKDVILVAVYNKKGGIIASNKKTEIDQRISKETIEELTKKRDVFKKKSFTQKGEEVYDFYSPIFISEILSLQPGTERELAGFARVGLSLERTYLQSKTIFTFGLIITALIILLGFALSIFLTGKMIKPLKELTKGTEIIGKGNLAYQIEIKTGDEIEELAESFNQMTKSLGQSRTALEKAKRKAEEEKEKTLTIITNFADGLLVFNEEKKLSLVNPQAEKFFNIGSEKVVGKSISELNKFLNLLPLISILEKEVKGIFRKELQLKENLVLEVSTIPIVGYKEGLGALVILHDVTREKMVERMKTEFVSLSAHQLRTPLSAIKWTLKMLLDGDLGKITKEQRNFIKKTYKSNEMMINLINDLLNVIKIEEGRYLFNPVLASPEGIVQSVIESYKEEIKKKKIKFEFKKPEKKLPEIKVDVEKIGLAIDNLIDNAIRYTPAGGEVTVSLKYVKKEIEFSIKDTGVGISSDQQARIFTKFFRAINAVRMETEGSGLGLFITKNIIEAHKGKIWFESEENKGSTFWFTLPLRNY